LRAQERDLERGRVGPEGQVVAHWCCTPLPDVLIREHFKQNRAGILAAVRNLRPQAGQSLSMGCPFCGPALSAGRLVKLSDIGPCGQGPGLKAAGLAYP